MEYIEFLLVECSICQIFSYMITCNKIGLVQNNFHSLYNLVFWYFEYWHLKLIIFNCYLNYFIIVKILMNKSITKIEDSYFDIFLERIIKTVKKKLQLIPKNLRFCISYFRRRSCWLDIYYLKTRDMRVMHSTYRTCTCANR